MFRMLHQARGAAYAVGFVAGHNNSITFTRSIHNVKLVGLHNKLHQPALEMLQLHGIKLHGPVISTVSTGQVHQEVHAAVNQATLQNIILVPLHDSLHRLRVEKLSFNGLCLHDHERYFQSMNQANPETTADKFSQFTSDAPMVIKSNSIESPRISVAHTKISDEDTILITGDSAEMHLSNKVSFGECVAAIGRAVESLTWIHNGRPGKDLQSLQDPQTTTHERN